MAARTPASKRPRDDDDASPPPPLSGVVFMLSGFVNPERGQLRDALLALGAKYSADEWKIGTTTHLISAYERTPKSKEVNEKIVKALSTLPAQRKCGAAIVSKEWVLACKKDKTWANEKDHEFASAYSSMTPKAAKMMADAAAQRAREEKEDEEEGENTATTATTSTSLSPSMPGRKLLSGDVKPTTTAHNDDNDDDDDCSPPPMKRSATAAAASTKTTTTARTPPPPKAQASSKPPCYTAGDVLLFEPTLGASSSVMMADLDMQADGGSGGATFGSSSSSTFLPPSTEAASLSTPSKGLSAAALPEVSSPPSAARCKEDEDDGPSTTTTCVLAANVRIPEKSEKSDAYRLASCGLELADFTKWMTFLATIATEIIKRGNDRPHTVEALTKRFQEEFDWDEEDLGGGIPIIVRESIRVIADARTESSGKPVKVEVSRDNAELFTWTKKILGSAS